MNSPKFLLTIFLFCTVFTSTLLGNTYGFFVAVGGYSGNVWSPIDNPVKDSEALVNLLESRYDFDQIVTLYDEDATKKNIVDYLSNIAAQLRAEDDLLIFFSGHGTEIEGEGYWVPFDAITEERSQLISNTEIRDILSTSKSKHLLLLSDACFSGAVFNGNSLYVKNDGSEDYYENISSLLARQVMVSGSLTPSLEDANSVFVKYLLKFLEKNQQPYLTTSELFDLIKFPVAANAPKAPILGHLQEAGHEGGQFIFKLINAAAMFAEAKQTVAAEETETVVEETKTECTLKVEIEEGTTVTFEKGGRLHAIASKGGVTYEWLKGATPLDITTPSLEVNATEQYTVIVTDEYNCSHAATVNVEIVIPDVFVTIVEGSQVDFVHKGMLNANTNLENPEMEWRHNNFIVGNNKQLEVFEDGIYTVNIKASTGQTIATATTEVNIRSREYTVRMGDNLERIARLFYGSETKKSLIVEANPSISANEGGLKIGQKIILPPDKKEVQTIEAVVIGGVQSLAPLSAPGIFGYGIITDIASVTFKEMKRSVSVQFMPMNRVKAGAFNGMFTAALPFAKNEIDAINFYYSDPLYRILNVFFAKNNADITYNKAKDLKGLTVAISGGVVIPELNELLNDNLIKVTSFKTLEACFQKLNDGEVDLVAAPQLVGLTTLRNMTTVETNNFKMLEKAIGTEDLFLIVSKQHPNAQDLVDQFNNTFRKLQASGKIDELINEHLDRFQQSLADKKGN